MHTKFFFARSFWTPPLSEVSKRGWREGVGDEQPPQNSPKNSPEMCPPSPKGGIGKRVQKRGLNLSEGSGTFRQTFRDTPDSSFRNPRKTNFQSENSRRLWLFTIRCWKGFPANFDAAGKWFPDFPAVRNAIPAKVSAFSGKENGCWKIGCACGNAAGFSPPRPPQPSWVLLIQGRARTFRPPPLRVEKTPTPPGSLRTQKVNLCALFSYLKKVGRISGP